MAFNELVDAAQACRLCPAMEGRRRVLSESNGHPRARIMVIAEAPGRLGGELTGRPLVDDASGRRFAVLLREAGISRDDLFITNTVLCNPQDAAGRNRRPSRREIENCGGWLRLQIETIDPNVVLALGSVALAALSAIASHSYRLATHVLQPLLWNGRTLIPLYHPSPLTRAWRSDARQAEDYQWLGTYLRERGLIGAVPRQRPHAHSTEPAPEP
jgi:DNA polymerase